jgi:hypothetical protein
MHNVHQLRSDVEAEKVKAQMIGNQVGQIMEIFIFEKNEEFTWNTITKMANIYLDFVMHTEPKNLLDFGVQCDVFNNASAATVKGDLKLDLALKISEKGGFIFIPVTLKKVDPATIQDMTEELK